MKHVAEQYPLPGMPAPPAVPVKPKITYSFSALETAKCARKYYGQYIAKSIPREETYQLAAGTIADTAFNAYYESNGHLYDNHETRMAYARAAVEVLLAEKPHWFDESTFPWSKKAGDPRSCPENYVMWLFDEKTASGKSALELICRHDRGQVEVQKQVRIELPEFDIIGYIDCFEVENPRVVDVKVVTGWGGITELQYALRGQIPLYLMALKDSLGIEAKGSYELLLGRKKAQLVEIPVHDLEDLQQKIIDDFHNLHRLRTKNENKPCTAWKKNPDQCLTYNRPCSCFATCWPALVSLLPNSDN